ncbi:hypothetical protein EIP91_007560 [Steccherinum ochraceum]|uniref:BTB domain-containing protein n=1 Tax=Steccherinum ochraceum TaxID=92696 RepID=A0A4R0RSW2_9APHY|nr:hypothetical protein EIP91_007560 [Steccherinum ochraceum]
MAPPQTRSTASVSADPPFDDTSATAPHGPQADIVLRTADNVDFYVHAILLRLASSFFNHLLSLPQPTKPSDADVVTSSDGRSLHLIPVLEDSQTMDYLLRLCYPVAEATPTTDLNIVAKVLKAAMKYEFEAATSIHLALFRSFIPKDPRKAFAIACSLELEQEAQDAASQWKTSSNNRTPSRSQWGGYSSCPEYSSHTLSQSRDANPCQDVDCKFRDFEKTGLGKSFVPEMKNISAGCYFRFIRYLQGGLVSSFCTPPPCAVISPSHDITDENLSAEEDVLLRCPPDIALESSDGCLVQTHYVILAYASATSLLDKADDPECPWDEGMPVVEVEEDAATLRQLLRLCIPLKNPSSTEGTFESAYAVWMAARKYGMKQVEGMAKERWMRFLEDEPVRVYFTALRHGWTAEAERAARHLASGSSGHNLDATWYTPEMEYPTSSAQDLYRLLKYCHEYRSIRAQVADKARYDFRSSRHGKVANVKQIALQMHGVALVAYPVVAHYGSYDSMLAKSLDLFAETLVALDNLRLQTNN